LVQKVGLPFIEEERQSEIKRKRKKSRLIKDPKGKELGKKHETLTEASTSKPYAKVWDVWRKRARVKEENSCEVGRGFRWNLSSGMN